jgi:hypothetical protein
MPAANFSFTLNCWREVTSWERATGITISYARYSPEGLTGATHKASRAYMRCNNRRGSSDSDDRGKVLKYRPPKPGTETERYVRDVSEADVVQLLDLSKYEKPRETSDEFKARMTENMAALIVLGVFISIAATDFIAIEQLQRGATIWEVMH